MVGLASTENILRVPIERISPNPRQPRRHFKLEALKELAESIREVGVLQPLVVRASTNGYELIAGERRLRASKLAGLETVPVLVRQASDMAMLELAIIENVQREDISAVESARAYRRLIDEFGLTQEQVADKVGKSRVAVANTVRLLRLPTRIVEAIETAVITEGHGRALLGLPNQVFQLAVFDRVVRDGLSVKQVERIASGTKVIRRQKSASGWSELQEQISMRLGSPTRIEEDGGKGRISIDFFSEDDLQRILELLGI